MDKHIFVVDDDANIAELIKLYFEKEGFKVSTFSNGSEVLKAIKKHAPNLVVLDIMMPMMDGYEVLKEIRKISAIPVIMLTAKGETFDKVLGLELGADDYLVKPFEPKELLARVKAVLRRIGSEDVHENVTVLPNLTIDMDAFVVNYHGKTMQLPPKELELLNHLVTHPNRVFTREQLLDKIWGFDYYGDTRTVDVHIKRLREKFSEEDPWEIKTVWGVGYKFAK
ncbi:MAG: DNA-binding response regulator [Clostridiales bacterium]|nr:MAG: DNA-binding response regulator [Clostridiales bacterium]PIE77144.1 MAG: DNA-binding response regulator [Clostridiales bacterium]